MKASEFKSFYLALDRSTRARFLARLAFNLTIDARSTYVPQSEAIAEPSRLRGFNELQHRVLGHLSALLDRPSERLDEEPMADLLIEAVDELGCGYAVREATERVQAKAPAGETAHSKRAV